MILGDVAAELAIKVEEASVVPTMARTTTAEALQEVDTVRVGMVAVQEDLVGPVDTDLLVVVLVVLVGMARLVVDSMAAVAEEDIAGTSSVKVLVGMTIATPSVRATSLSSPLLIPLLRTPSTCSGNAGRTGGLSPFPVSVLRLCFTVLLLCLRKYCNSHCTFLLRRASTGNS